MFPAIGIWWHQKKIIPSLEERGKECGGELQSLQEGGECWVGVVAPLHPSILPSIHPCVGEHLWSHPELDGTVGHRQGFCAAPTHSFAPCLSFPAGKQAPFPRSRLGTIANLAAVIAGVGSSITQSQDC